MRLRGYSPRESVALIPKSVAQLPTASSFRHGFTIIEIMISLTVMTVGIMAAMSTIATMQGARQYTSELIRLQAIANAVNERLLSMPATDIAITANAQWTSLGSSPVSFATLEAAGIIDRRSGVRDSAQLWDVKKNDELPGVYISYYRGVGQPTYDVNGVKEIDPSTGYPKFNPARPGLMDAGQTWSVNANAQLFPNGVRLLSTFLEDPLDPDASKRNPVVIRIRVVSGDGIVELFTARTLG
jgi:prepilin-type N-terminal cleavage/methylation domain-containing protein